MVIINLIKYILIGQSFIYKMRFLQFDNDNDIRKI